jgi:hypothetical protein
MHWHNELRAGVVGHLHGLLGIAVTANPGVVTTDRHDREINRAVTLELLKVVGHGGVAAENDSPAVALDKVAVVPAVIIVLHPRAPVFHPERDDVDLAGHPAATIFAPLSRPINSVRVDKSIGIVGGGIAAAVALRQVGALLQACFHQN